MQVIHFLISWSHIISASLSLVFGAMLIFRAKGDASHAKFGKYYFYSMLVNNVTALFIFKATGQWFFPHTLAVITLVLIIPSYYILRIKHSGAPLIIHIIGMVLSYYMLIGGAINEAFIHIPALTPLMMEQSPAFGMTHFAAQLIFLFLLIYFPVKYRKFGKGSN